MLFLININEENEKSMRTLDSQEFLSKNYSIVYLYRWRKIRSRRALCASSAYGYPFSLSLSWKYTCVYSLRMNGKASLSKSKIICMIGLPSLESVCMSDVRRLLDQPKIPSSKASDRFVIVNRCFFVLTYV